jgi:hypothetical protein
MRRPRCKAALGYNAFMPDVKTVRLTETVKAAG